MFYKRPSVIAGAAILFGAALPLAFAPFHWVWLIALIPGLYEILLNKSKKAALTGFLFGLGFFGVGASWVFVSIHEYGGTSVFLALFITVGFVAILSGMLSGSAWLYQKLKASSFKKRFMIFPALWALTEAFRGWFLTGFPWLFLGDTIIDTPMRGYLPIIGVFGVSWLLVALSMLLIKSWRNIPFLLAAIAIGYGLTYIHWTKPTDFTYRVTLIQGNIPQLLKWDPKQADANFMRYYQLTKQSLASDVIIWPEASLPVPMPFGEPYVEALTELVSHKNNAILIGELYSAGEEGFLNSAQAIGNGSHRYDKTHLVPFGEYLPFYDLLGPLLEDLRLPTPTAIPGESNQIPLVLKNWRAGVMICYEIAYPMLTLHSAQDTDVLITISNDTWFGHSIGPQQHFQIARTRAIETGRYLLRATNNGITGFIAPDGKVLSEAPQFVATTLTHDVTGMQGRTPLMIYGHLSILLAAVSMIILAKIKYR